MSKPTSRSSVSTPTTLTIGESAYLLTGDHPFQDINDKFDYTVSAISKGRFDLIAVIEHAHGYLEPVGSRVQLQSVYFHRRSFDGTVVHAAAYEWPCSHEHEERIYISLTPDVTHIALMLGLPAGADSPVVTHVMSGKQVSTRLPMRQHYQIDTPASAEHLRGSRQIVGVIHNHHSAVRLEVPELPRVDLTSVLSLSEAEACFGDRPRQPAEAGDTAS